MKEEELEQIKKGLQNKWPLLWRIMRRGACKKLARDSSASVVPLLVAALHNTDPKVQEIAQNALHSLKDQRAINAFLRKAKADPLGKGAQLYLHSHIMHEPTLQKERLDLLLAALKHPDPDTRVISENALISFNNPKAIDSLFHTGVKRPKEDAAVFYMKVCERLNKQSPEQSILLLLNALKINNDEIISAAMTMLRSLTDDRAIDEVFHLAIADPTGPAAAVYIPSYEKNLRESPGEYVNLLIGALKHPSSDICSTAANKLGSFLDNNVIDELYRFACYDPQGAAAAIYIRYHQKHLNEYPPNWWMRLLVGALEHADSDVRNVAECKLSSLTDNADIRELCRFANATPQGPAATVCIRNYGKYLCESPAESVSLMVGALINTNSNTRDAAESMLSSLSDSDAIQELYRFAYSDPLGRAASIYIRRYEKHLRGGPPNYVRFLAGALGHCDSNIRSAAESMLLSLSNNSAINELWFLAASDPLGRAASIYIRNYAAISSESSAHSVGLLVAALKHPDSETCDAAATILRSLSDNAVIESIRKLALEDPLGQIASIYIQSFQTNLREAAAGSVRFLIAALNHADPKTSEAAAAILSSLSDNVAIKLLRELAMEDPLGQVASIYIQNYQESFHDASSKSLSFLLAALKHPDTKTRKADVAALSSLSGKTAIKLLFNRAMKDPLGQVASIYIQNYQTSLRKSWSVRLLGAALNNTDAETRKTAATLLSSLSDNDAIESLFRLAMEEPLGQSASIYIQRYQEIILKSSVESLPLFISALKHADTKTRDAAAAVLSLLTDRAAIDALIKIAIDDPSGDVAQICVQSGKRPRDPEQACLFLFITRQLDEYFKEDDDFQHLRDAYGRADVKVKMLVMDVIRSGDRRCLDFFGGQRKTLRECTAEEIQLAIDVAQHHKDWPRLFRAFLELPPRYGCPILDHLRRSSWEPAEEDMKGLLHEALAISVGLTLPKDWIDSVDGIKNIYEFWPAMATPADLEWVEALLSKALPGRTGTYARLLRLLIVQRLVHPGEFVPVEFEAGEFAGEFTEEG
jgi:HEAT repeat protein